MCDIPVDLFFPFEETKEILKEECYYDEIQRRYPGMTPGMVNKAVKEVTKIEEWIHDKIWRSEAVGQDDLTMWSLRVWEYERHLTMNTTLSQFDIDSFVLDLVNSLTDA